MKKLKAYDGKQENKDKYLARVRAHKAADEIRKGIYWKRGKGCAVGCTIHGENHKDYEQEDLQIPQTLARLEDRIFEGLSLERKEWPEKFLNAIEPGADLSDVWRQFVIWLLIDPTHGVIKYAQEDNKKAIELIAQLHIDKCNDSRSFLNAASSAAASYDDASSVAASYAAARATCDAAYAVVYAAEAAYAVASYAASSSAAARATYAVACASDASSTSAYYSAASSAAASAAASTYAARASSASAAASTYATRASADDATYAVVASSAYAAQSEKLLELLIAAPVLEE